MNKIFLFFFMFSIFSMAQHHTGINTTQPKATLDIQAADGAEVNGILIPRVNSTKRSAFINPENGLMVYNTDLKCYEINVGTPNAPDWECVATVKNVQTISIEPRGFLGNFKYGIVNDPSVHKVLFEVTNNTSRQLTDIDLSYVNVEGRSQYIERGQNQNVSIPANGSVLLEYGISGANLSDTSKFTLTYDQYSSASIQLKIDNRNLDENLHGIGNSGNATFNDLEQKFLLLNYQGASVTIDESITITNSNPLQVDLSFTQGVGNYLSYTSPEIEIVDIHGATRRIQLTYPEGNLDIGKGVITANIISLDGNDLTLPQTTLGGEDIIAEIPIKLNDKNKGIFKLIAFGGIPDRRFGDGSGHDFVYMPVVSPTGRVWLNNNLGAEYNRVDSDVFNPTQQATALNDQYAYGSRFQYRRFSDGHELYIAKANGSYKRKNSSTYNQATNFRPETSVVYYDPLSKSNVPKANREYNWIQKSYLNAHSAEWNTLWKVDGTNNPCPVGYRPPSEKELNNEINYLKEKSDLGLLNSPLKFVSYQSTYTWFYDRNHVLVATPSSVYANQSNAYQIAHHLRCIKHE